MTDDAANPSETSPLLGRPAATSLEPGDAPDGVRPNGTLPNGTASAPVKPDDDEERQAGDADRSPQYEGMPEVKKSLKFIVPAIAIGVFLSAGDQTIIVSSYGKIGSDLKALNNTSWIATAYFLTLTSFQPLYGRLSDIFGRKPALLFGYAVFGLGCLFCGLARDMNELIAARAFAGIGGGGMTTVVSIMMSDIVPLRERGTWQGIINIIYASGAGCGAPLGGVLADYIGWRWAFLGQAPMCLLAFITVSFVLKLPKRESSDWKSKLRRIDFLGAFVLVCAVFTLLLGLDRGSNVSWRAPITIASLCISFPAFILFILVEMKLAKEPFAPGHIILERSLFACYLCNFFSFGGWLSALFYIPLFFQAVDGLSATQAGVRLLPGIVAGVSGSLFGGILMQKTGKYYWLTVCAYTTLTLGMIPILLSTGLVANSTYGISVGLVMCGFSNGIGVTTSLIALIANASPQDQAVATACSYLFRSLGSVVGLSISATVVQQSLRTQLKARLKSGKDADLIVRRVRESLDYIKTLEPEVRGTVRQCYESATRAGFGLMLCIVACAMLSSFANIYVGREKVRFTLPKNLACRQGRYFRRCFPEDFEEDQDASLHLPEDNPERFEVLVEWFYQGKLRPAGSEHGLTAYTYFQEHVEVYLLAHKLDILDLQNAIMDELRAVYIQIRSEYPIEISSIRKVYQATDDKSDFLCKFVCDAAAMELLDHAEQEHNMYRECLLSIPAFAVEFCEALRDLHTRDVDNIKQCPELYYLDIGLGD